MESNRDRTKTKTSAKFQFAPFRPEGDGVALPEAGLSSDEELIVFERAGGEMALVMREMAYHHVAQGELNGEPYIVTF